ncbi:ribonuclease domain-containing protein [Paenibacillus pasadenensis]|uniref:Ribonuclease n=1 Tax=Paenibacillus pasadenensis TaxID=217090 RepID=A0A2N5N544_9BACL|nr:MULTISPECIES: ribonuclease domain-containing protein [Paenibacillus]PLT45471.1 Ribonuclease [Paenibacillus pasadenensis]QGG55949.1 ribonuclease [Paenibacillus sp. B01]
MKSVVRLIASISLVLALVLGSSPQLGLQAVPSAAAAVSGPTDFAGIISYLKANGKLPPNFLTKSQATSRGWVSSQCNLATVAPGYSIGGDTFQNREGKLPAKSGRTWKEADAYYSSGCRNASRVLYSNDGLYYTTSDHYVTFTKWN